MSIFARAWVRNASKFESVIVEPALVRVEKTSAGIEISLAPLSIVKFSVILSLMTTGTTNVPCSLMSGIDSACAEPHASSSANTIVFCISFACLMAVSHGPEAWHCVNQVPRFRDRAGTGQVLLDFPNWKRNQRYQERQVAPIPRS